VLGARAVVLRLHPPHLAPADARGLPHQTSHDVCLCAGASQVLTRCCTRGELRANAKCHSGRRTVRPGVEQSCGVGWYIDFASFTLCHILLQRRHLHCVLCHSGGDVTCIP